MTHVIFQSGLQQLLVFPNGPVGRDLWRRGKRVEWYAKRDVGVRTGRLRASINTNFVPSPIPLSQTVQVGSDVNHSLIHHEGTRPHFITPNRKKALSFKTKSGRVVAKVVKHPGTRANRYLSGNLWRAVL